MKKKIKKEIRYDNKNTKENETKNNRNERELRQREEFGGYVETFDDGCFLPMFGEHICKLF